MDRDLMNLILEKGHSRVPVYYEEPTNIIGLVLVICKLIFVMIFYCGLIVVFDLYEVHGLTCKDACILIGLLYNTDFIEIGVFRTHLVYLIYFL